MHILSGDLKNRFLEAPKRAKTRPTSSKLRAQLFNICQHYVANSHFLDLFAGSGAIGLEAISRGAANVIFVDHDSDAICTIKKNIETCDVKSQCRCVYSDVIHAIRRLHKEIVLKMIPSFDIVFIDPPYYEKQQTTQFFVVGEVVTFFDQESDILLSHTGRLFIEESRSSPLHSLSLHSLELVSKRAAGNSCLYEFQKKR